MAGAGEPDPVGEELGRVETLAVVTQPLVWAGIGRRFPWALVGLESQARIGWGIVALLLLLGGLPAARWLRATPARRSAVRLCAVVLLLSCPPLTAGFDFVSSRHFARFGYSSPGLLLLLDAATLLAIVLWLRAPGPPGRGIALAAIAAAAHRLGAAALFPLDERRSDMLAVALHAAGVAIGGGEPYVETMPQGLKYLPGTWLAHGPAALLGVDPRVPGALIVLGIGLALARSLRRGAGAAPAANAGLAELLAMLVLLNPYHAFRHDLYFDAFLALSAAVFHLAARGAGTRRALAAVAVLTGLAAATRPWAWVYGPFALLSAAIGGGPARRPILARVAFAGALALCVAGAVVVPWIAQDAAAFRRGVFAFSGEIFGEACLGLVGLASALGLARWLPALQLAVCAGAFAFSLRAARGGEATNRAVLARGWLVWAAVVLMNPFLENYFYLSPGFAAAASAIGARASVIGRT
jgi:hypothetical protein